MKSSLSHLTLSSVSLLSLVGLCLTGCNNTNAPSPLNPMTAVTQEVQGHGNCLDLGRLARKINRAKKVRTVMTDMQFDRPASEAMLANTPTLHNENTDGDSFEKGSTIVQTDCRTILITDEDGVETAGTIIEHSRTHLKIQMNVAAAPGLAEATLPAEATFDLTSESRVTSKLEIPSVMAHECNGKSDEEMKQRSTTTIIDFGDKLAARPTPSVELIGLQAATTLAQQKLAKDPTALETEFCSSGQ